MRMERFGRSALDFQTIHGRIYTCSQGPITAGPRLLSDNDPEVIRVWKEHGHTVLACLVPVEVSTDHSRVGVYGGIEEHSWFNLLRKTANVWMTMSPPCQSWSGGGSESGLNSETGFCFIEGIAVVLNVRLLALTAERSDKLTSHPHFKLLRFLLTKAGYKLIWTAIGDHSQVAHMSRRRWLAVYIRNDIEAVQIGGAFKINGERLGWNHESFNFLNPQVVEEQLELSQSLLDLYGNPDCLPKGMMKGNPSPNL